MRTRTNKWLEEGVTWRADRLRERRDARDVASSSGSLMEQVGGGVRLVVILLKRESEPDSKARSRPAAQGSARRAPRAPLAP